MGEGKTEAALLAAEALAHQSGAGGCFVALPTQATSDAMFGRVLQWLRALPTDGSVEPASVHLAHGKSALNDTYTGLFRRGSPSSVGADEKRDREHVDGAIVAHRWLSGRKKGVLASFVVGTIDQVLFAGLKSRHLALRHLALAGKVVIIDEVHAYDLYMSRYLDRVLQWLAAYGVPVVLLSATLPAGRRAELLVAYESGADSEAPGVDARTEDYPVVLGTYGAGVHGVAASPRETVVQLDHLPDDLDTLVAYLREHLADGGCAVVVRNTVARVQETADRVAAAFGEDVVTVNHARFLSCDRARIDRALLRRFGTPAAQAARPVLHIVVASQVVEQSLDVDFDLMITDLAPTDLVLQRMGRLHRHERLRPKGVRRARCALVGVEDWAAEPVRAISTSNRIYSREALLRSAVLLRPQVRQTVVLPADISPLVQVAYGGGLLGPAAWQSAMGQASEAARMHAAQQSEKAQAYLLGQATVSGSLVGWLSAGVGDADDTVRGAAQVRDGDESLEVLVVQADADGGLLVPAWIDGGGQQIPLDSAVPVAQARTLAACTLRLPFALSHGGVIVDVIAALERNQFTSFQLSPLLKGELVLVLDADRNAVVQQGRAQFRLTYDLQRGLLHEQL